MTPPCVRIPFSPDPAPSTPATAGWLTVLALLQKQQRSSGCAVFVCVCVLPCEECVDAAVRV